MSDGRKTAKKLRFDHRGKYREEDYRYAAAKAAALSRELISEQGQRELLRTLNASDIEARLAEYGFDASVDTETAITRYLSERYNTLISFCPSTPLARMCRLKYDCSNLKSAIKCDYGKRDPRPLMIECGCIPTDDVINAVMKRDFSKFAAIIPNMSRGAAMAAESLDRSGASRTVDSLLDRACFADMREAAVASGIREVYEIIERRTDQINLLTVARVMRLRSAELRRAVFDDSVLSGGRISTEALRNAEDTEKLCLLAEEAGYHDSAVAIAKTDGTAAGLETLSLAFDNDLFTELAHITSMKLLGAYPIIAYIAELELETKNLRIITSGIKAGEDRALIESRLRTAKAHREVL